MGKEWRNQDITDALFSLQIFLLEIRNFQTPEERTLAIFQQYNKAFMDSSSRILLYVDRNY